MGIYITLAVLVFVVISFLLGKWPFGLTAMIGATLLNITGVLEFNEAFANFASSNVIMVGGMFVLSVALGKTSLVENIRTWGMKQAGNSSRMLLFSFLITTILLAQFLPPTGIITMMIPFTATLTDDGPLPKTRVIYPISATSFFWQGVLPIGMGLQMTGMLNGYLESAGADQVLRIYDLALVGIVPAVIMLGYMMIIGYKLLPQRASREIEASINEVASTHRSNSSSLPKSKENIIYVIFILTMIGMIFADKIQLTMGVIPVLGVILLMITGCIGQKEVISSLNMDVIFMLVGVMSLSTALDKTGAGNLIADGIITILGGNPSPLFIMAVFFLVPCIITQFMSNTASWVLIIPLAIMTAMRMGYDPRGIALLTKLAANTACMTPMAAPSMAIAFGAGGYTLKDYLKTGAPMLLIYGVSAVLWALFIYPPM